MTYEVITFFRASTMLKDHPARYGDEKKIAHNTVLYEIDNDTFGIKYHKTTMIKIHRDGSYTLDTDGHAYYSSTRLRFKFTPAQVYQRKGEVRITSNGREVDYEDGMRVDSFGDLILEEATNGE